MGMDTKRLDNMPGPSEEDLRAIEAAGIDHASDEELAEVGLSSKQLGEIAQPILDALATKKHF